MSYVRCAVLEKRFQETNVLRLYATTAVGSRVSLLQPLRMFPGGWCTVTCALVEQEVLLLLLGACYISSIFSPPFYVCTNG